MGKLVYGMITSLDGYVEDEYGDFGWGAPADPELHAYINQLAAPVGTYLYGRRMYDTMVFWETALEHPDLAPVEREWALQWQATDKVVFSRTLQEPRSTRTRIEREFDPQAVKRLKEDATRDITIDGPELASHALRAGLVDEVQMIVSPLVLGGGKRFFPPDLRIELELLEERSFEGSGVVVLRYAVKASRPRTETRQGE